MTAPAFFVDQRTTTQEAFYRAACDPRRSVAVQACAGSGKTWMLVARIVRALLEGVEPAAILAITFTRKAAGEMSERLHEALQALADPALSDTELEAQLVMRGMTTGQARAAGPGARALARRVGMSAQGVQVRTIHAWFANLLSAAPQEFLLAHHVPDPARLLESDDAVRAESVRRLLARMAATGEGRAAFDVIVGLHGRSQALLALDHALAQRANFVAADAAGRVDSVVLHFSQIWPDWEGLGDPHDVLDQGPVRARWLAWASGWAAQRQSKSLAKLALEVQGAFDRDELPRRLQALQQALCPKDSDDLRKNLEDNGDAQAAHGELLEILAAVRQHDAWRHHQAMTELARLLVAEHTRLKRERGWLDMVDIEQLTHTLLSDPICSGWVQERLDARYRHILIDEFQDTNPVQWQALTAWLQAYAGAGGSAPAIFIVGDPKQSIYSFRGAEPAVFDAAQDLLVKAFDAVCLRTDHTRRCAQAVTAAVNRVLPAALAAVSSGEGATAAFSPHTTASDAVGMVSAFAQIPRPPRRGGQARAGANRQGSGATSPDVPPWRDALVEPPEPDQDHVHDQCSTVVADWIAAALAAGRKPQDVLVLARKRERLARLADHLTRRRIPFEQPEQTHLSDSPAARDIVALIDALTSPSHDLSLAQALRSPLFGWPDEWLQALAARVRFATAPAAEPATWLSVLASYVSPTAGAPASTMEGAWADAGARLGRWQGWLAALPLHDALVAVFEDADVLAAFARACPPAQRGAEVMHLRGLLQASLNFEAGRFVTPYAFVRAFRQGEKGAHDAFRLPAQAGAEHVRLLTIHGAKGLEAPIVIVLDSDASAARSQTMGSVCDWPAADAHPRAFAFLASEAAPAVGTQEIVQARAVVRDREEVNALYVAMTRAREHLVFASVEPHPSPSRLSWWRLLHDAFGLPMAVQPPASGPAFVPVALQQPVTAVNDDFSIEILPNRPEVIVKSSLDAILFDGSVESSNADVARMAALGTAMHRVLQGLPLHAAGTAAALRDDDVRAACSEVGLLAKDNPLVRDAVLRITRGAGAFCWDAERIQWAANEVPVTVDGARRRVDRLVHTVDGAWWILDYKWSDAPEKDGAMLAQLAGYLRAVRGSMPDATVRAAFLTAAGQLIECTDTNTCNGVPVHKEGDEPRPRH